MIIAGVETRKCVIDHKCRPATECIGCRKRGSEFCKYRIPKGQDTKERGKVAED